ncbi:MAG: Nif3-like dinuclear metal center hexameric protein [Armatimonadota bacterium]|nr:Nif3-like dinuclear metal center hexameric protein [Armatimonadota bacterium]
MKSVLLNDLVPYLDAFLRLGEWKDYPGAWNGLEVEGRSEVRLIAAAVDGSAASAEAAAEMNADLLLVHHGFFWDSHRPIVGRYLRRLAPLIRNEISVYSAHLPLDAHPEVGNSAILLRKLGLEPTGSFYSHGGKDVGLLADTDVQRDDIAARLQTALGGPIRNQFLFGPERCHRVGVITGGGGSAIGEAKDAGVDLFITGEGAQHTYFDARELELNVFYGGHYATETFGVKALAAHLKEHFGVEWKFLDIPTGL